MNRRNDIGGSENLTPEQIEILILIERIGAGFSMVAIALIVTTYSMFEKMRTTPNLFLLFASIANAGASVASMIGYDGVEQGASSSLCQAQGFILESFMQSDPWWSCAMAINVFMVFFFNARTTQFRKYLWVYCLACFGGPMISAIVLIAIQGDQRGLVYGDAALWCWIGARWSLVRLYAYYIPIWICILLSIVIYIAVGYRVFHQRNQSRSLLWPASPGHNISTPASSGLNESGLRESNEGVGSCCRLTRTNDLFVTAVTEVHVTTNLPKTDSQEFLSSLAALPSEPSPVTTPPFALKMGQRYPIPGIDINAQRFETVCSSDNSSHPKETVFKQLRAVKSTASLKLRRLDPVKMAYLRTSFIFGFAVLITWIPSSINRIYSISKDGQINFPLSMASGSVLPLQGVWNAVIYFTTSWSIFRQEVLRMYAELRRKDTKQQKSATRLNNRLREDNERPINLDLYGLPTRNMTTNGPKSFEDLDLARFLT